MPKYTVQANRVQTGYVIVEADDIMSAVEVAEAQKGELEHIVTDDSLYFTFATPNDLT